MEKTAIIIGNSDGIGLAVSQRLLDEGWNVTGISKSGSKIKEKDYEHHKCDVTSSKYKVELKKIINKNGVPDLCIYCPGIGELLDLDDMDTDIRTFEVNLIGMVRTVSVVIPEMEEKGSGHFVGLSSFADEMLSYDSPAYSASKAGFTAYLESLALALEDTGVKVTNVRFGFVNTKMAKGDVKPFIMPVEKAADHLMKCIRKKPSRYSAPAIVIPFIKFRRIMLNMKIFFK
ncbi:MAG: SDR family NAD(P)-dependent oxidoreductase [Acidobacteriota bacterium]